MHINQCGYKFILYTLFFLNCIYSYSFNVMMKASSLLKVLFFLTSVIFKEFQKSFYFLMMVYDLRMYLFKGILL